MDELIKPGSYKEELRDLISIFQGTLNNKAEGVNNHVPDTVEERAKQRIFNEEIIRQQNIEDVIDGAAERLALKGFEVHPVNVDWISQFKNKVQDISDNEMKMIWSKVLAGEIIHPKSYSLRTLDLLSKLSKEDAEIIMEVAPYTLFEDPDKMMIIHLERKDDKLVDFEKLLFLSELGLLETSASLRMDWSSEELDDSKCIKLRNNGIGINIIINTNSFSLPVYSVTTIGRQLFSLIEGVVPNVDYFKNTLDNLSVNTICECGHIKNKGDNKGFVFKDQLFKIDKLN